MDEDAYSMNVNCIVADHINYKIEKAGFPWQTSPTRNCPHNEVLSTVRLLCDEFERRYRSSFVEMCKECSELQFDANSYFAVLDELIVEGEFNWGRIIAILTFSGVMAVHCMEKDRPDRVDLIREWTCSFMQNKVEKWVRDNNGWRGMVEFYRNGKEKEGSPKKGGWSVLLGALGAVAIGALVVNRA